MGRKRVTQIFPFLLPVRVMQRKMCFYAGMRFDGRRYAETIDGKQLPYKLFEAGCALYNGNTGFDMAYQENKVFNLKLAAKTLNGLLIRPGETFSFWRLVRHADKHIPYKDGLTVTNGKLTTAPGGGLCQMSNLLFWMFLHTPLTVTERSGHEVKEFPEPNSDEIKGVDATISEGWIDLKARNDTDCTYQISVAFDDENIIGTVFVDKRPQVLYRVANGGIEYSRESGGIYESVKVERAEIDSDTGEITGQKPLYTNKCKICYPLPENVEIKEAKKV
ncbi:glycopeptide resistance accessory protein VanW [Paenibacillus apiarius]|uniref:Glycopeptide resistance accessory protein VanW n=1 Tax=Paenibacillus apiarius TaxID=46240 RepID=A0ABT4DTG1_9BACL|nr:glycopeptide resistance accessory protein VanW [Paenibacillus apiarius]MCY9516795.1 glycopeptide resistance accessory protein VanW [Paenibacillus apiarius]MCY9520601.1 glycopeptide resistance accessory protein VanW [Paenibacillus apiarius]MCY9555452.1 glycopeptide resistance accessory protein VanW [Paenibacillus apiarius]MCY9561121.1 glycopeptide resistance accessory protein VanW [Paenibacillus apiarius]MCY9687081.1 glycopeptide resistance accessory protein VanW [Paenibacillus apiarius]